MKNIFFGKGLFPVLLLLVLTVCGCGRERAAEQPRSRESVKVARVKVVEVAPAPFIKKIAVIGTCRAKQKIRVGTDESGIIKEVRFDKGDHVTAGALLAELDDSTLRAQLAEMEAGLAMERHNHDKLLALKRGKGAVSDFDLKNAALRAEMAAARVEVVRSRLRRMKIFNPITGIVEKRHVEPGEFISPGSPLADIIDTSAIKVEAGIAERDLSYIRKGSEAVIVFDAYPGRTYKGIIDYISPEVDRSTGTFTIEVLTGNSDSLLKPGMMARIRLIKEECGECLLLPQDALVDTEAGRAVFVVSKQSLAVLKIVTIGETDMDRVVVSGGIEPGERVVIVGQRNLSDGEEVEIIQ